MGSETKREDLELGRFHGDGDVDEEDTSHGDGSVALPVLGLVVISPKTMTMLVVVHVSHRQLCFPYLVLGKHPILHLRLGHKACQGGLH